MADTKVTEMVRLSPDQFKKLESLATPPIITSQSTELQMAGVVGEQRILKLLRDGFVTG